MTDIGGRISCGIKSGRFFSLSPSISPRFFARIDEDLSAWFAAREKVIVAGERRDSGNRKTKNLN